MFFTLVVIPFPPGCGVARRQRVFKKLLLEGTRYNVFDRFSWIVRVQFLYHLRFRDARDLARQLEVVNG